MIRIPKEKLFDLMYETSLMLDALEEMASDNISAPGFDAITKEIVDAGLVDCYFEYMRKKSDGVQRWGKMSDGENIQQ